MGDFNNPPTLTNVVARNSSVGCEQFMINNNLAISDMMSSKATSTVTEINSVFPIPRLLSSNNVSICEKRASESTTN
eukprot:10901444-Ditylum_brightwellii.AAC.1